IDALGAAEKIALQVAAVLGHQFSIDAVRRVLGREAWTPQTLIEHRLVLSGKDTIQFAHALIREGVYASILKPERRRLHLAAADWSVGRDTALRAEHLAKAESPEAVPTFLAAVEEQVVRYHVDEALELLSRAESAALTPAERFAIALRRGGLFTGAGRS